MADIKEQELPERNVGCVVKIFSRIFTLPFAYSILPYIVLLGLGLSVFIFWQKGRDGAEQLGNFLVMAGAVTIARGVVLNRDASKFLSDLHDQEEAKPYRAARTHNILFRNLEMVHILYGSKSASQVISIYEKKLSDRGFYIDENGDLKRKDGVPKPKMISQKDLSKLLGDASKYAEAGTVLVVLGTAWIMGCAAFK
ncbi:hypothetical protein [Dyella sp. 20L07]|uniref:hypothetical protein n=1 Tax=Dyella sp. 20L07 TaxID=3384240 RepID=UPI003D278AFF